MDLSKELGAACSAGGRLPRRWIEAPPGLQLRALRLERLISQRHLAQEAGLSQSFVCRLEAGRADATFGTWKKLFEALGCLAAFALLPYAEEVEELLERGREEREDRQRDGLRARSPRRWR